MIKRNVPALILLLLTILIGCKKDPLQNPIPDTPNIDSYVGETYSITLNKELSNFENSDFECSILADNNNEIFTRTGNYSRLDGKPTLNFDIGLKDGEYRLLHLNYTVSNGDELINEQFGLGCKVKVSTDNKIDILDAYSDIFGLSGEGTEENPFIVSSYDHLKRIKSITNDQLHNKLLFKGTHFKQVCDIDMDMACWKSDNEYGWLPIGSSCSNPFRGVYDGGGYKITTLWSKRDESSGIGLFGFVESSIIRNVHIVNPEIIGAFATGALVGAIQTPGDEESATLIYNCSTQGGSVSSNNNGLATGALVGSNDMYNITTIDSCINNGTSVSGGYGVGGIIGTSSLNSRLIINQSVNNADVTSYFSGAGGLVGSADTVIVVSSENKGRIIGSKTMKNDTDNGCYGTGGLIGGSGYGYVYFSKNSGDIDGYVGVGGIVGSTRIGSDELMYNSLVTRACKNTGSITGNTSVGGICGEAQLSAISSINTGSVSGLAPEAVVGGIGGNTSAAIAHNSINCGSIYAAQGRAVSGVIGKTTWGSFLASQNFGEVESGSDYIGGVVGLAGNYTSLNCCSNSGTITNYSDGIAGGVVGEIGDQRTWSGADIANCVVGSIACVMGVIEGTLVISKAVTESVLAGTEALKHFNHLFHVIHLVTTAADVGPVISDIGMWSFGVHEMLHPEEAEEMINRMVTSGVNTNNEVILEIENYRKNHTMPSVSTDIGLSGSGEKDFNNNLKYLIDYFDSSSENSQTVTYNINEKREELYEQIENQKEAKEISQKVIGGVCIITITVAAIVSSIPSAGGSVAAAAGILGGIASIIGGTNSIIEGSSDFKANAVRITQCANFGRIITPNSSYVGGIAGQVHDYTVTSDCLNSGEFAIENKNSGAIIGKVNSAASIKKCINVGTGWNEALYNNSDAIIYYGNENYYYDVSCDALICNGYPNSLSIDELHDINQYESWDFGGETSRWSLTNQKGYFPIPYWSEMAIEIEEEAEHE